MLRNFLAVSGECLFLVSTEQFWKSLWSLIPLVASLGLVIVSSQTFWNIWSSLSIKVGLATSLKVSGTCSHSFGKSLIAAQGASHRSFLHNCQWFLWSSFSTLWDSYFPPSFFYASVWLRLYFHKLFRQAVLPAVNVCFLKDYISSWFN